MFVAGEFALDGVFEGVVVVARVGVELQRVGAELSHSIKAGLPLLVSEAYTFTRHRMFYSDRYSSRFSTMFLRAVPESIAVSRKRM